MPLTFLLEHQRLHSNVNQDDDLGNSTTSLNASSRHEVLDTTPNRTVSRQSKGSAADDVRDISDIDRLFFLAAILAFWMWLAMLISVYAVTDDWQYLDSNQTLAAQLAACCIAACFFVLMAPYIIQWHPLSGLMFATFVVQVVAVCTNCVLAFAPVPVLIDSITKAPVYLVRWCEWAPLAGLLTFVTEAMDISKSRNSLTWPVSIALLHFISCLGGLMLPFCTSITTWTLWSLVFCVSYVVMLPRCYFKIRKLCKIERGNSFSSLEYFDRIKFASQMLIVFASEWTLLILFYFFDIFIYRIADEHWLRKYHMAMIFDAFIDAVAKTSHMKFVVNIHASVFDREGRAQRQLCELRRLMSVLWDSSSDVICISVALQESKMTCMLSPSYTALIGATLPKELQDHQSVALMLEFQRLNAHAAPVVVTAVYIDSSEIPYGRSLRQAILADVPTDSIEVQRAVEIATVASAHNNSINGAHHVFNNTTSVNSSPLDTSNRSSCGHLLMYPMQRVTGEEVRCEFKVSPHGERALLAVIRDVTERYRRFEAERRAHSETVQRQREAQAVNRFTRHEVKNGLLAGIEFCDSLRDTIENMKHNLMGEGNKLLQIEAALADADRSRTVISELDNMLHEVLDTVLAEAMARDVIHEVYRPRLERVEVKGFLSSCNYGLGTNERFPLHAKGNVPLLNLDPQLLRYIHRNAFSNACKYGKKDGKVITTVEFFESSGLFEMNVINEPGQFHETLVQMGEAASEAVFRQGTRLHTLVRGDDDQMSSGDGAWIMQKCAKTLGGRCRIVFEPSRTIFTFSCRAQSLTVLNLPATEDFEVPSGSWGLAIDDSAIQRRLLNRILAHAGVEESKRVVIGKDSSDAVALGHIVRKILNEDDTCKILIIVDENLDFAQSDLTHVLLSGSAIMKDILITLTPSQESRILALVRSANDSTEDILTYMDRVHGFFPKAPMLREKVKEILAPLWAERFMLRSEDISPIYVNDSNVDDEGISTEELLNSMEEVNKLFEKEDFDDLSWPRLWSALHSFKGDLMVVDGMRDMELPILLIYSLRGEKAPTDLHSKWNEIRKLVMKAVLPT